MSYYGGQQPYYGGQQQPQPGYQPQGANPYVSGGPSQPGWNVPQQTGQGVYGAGNTQYMEEGGGGIPKSTLGFNDKTIRAMFVRKVFFLVAIMLFVVALMSGIPFIHPPLMTFVKQNYGLYLMGYITFIIVYFALICSESLRRSYPANMICLGLLTLSIGYMTMMITAYHTFESVFICFLITAISCAAISLFSMSTKKDLTSLMGIMFIATLCLALFGLIVMFVSIFSWHSIRTLYVVYAAIGAFLFMIWLAIDIQMIMGGRTYEISPEEHILAAILLFLDIIQIFWFLLTIFGERDR